MPIGTFTFCSLLTVPPGAAFAVAGRPASSSPQVSARPASTRQCSASGVFRAGRCVVGVDIAPNDERRADVPEIRTFRRHPAERRQARQEGGEREQERTEDDVRTVKQANTSPFMPSYRRPAAPCRTSVLPSETVSETITLRQGWCRRTRRRNGAASPRRNLDLDTPSALTGCSQPADPRDGARDGLDAPAHCSAPGLSSRTRSGQRQVDISRQLLSRRRLQAGNYKDRGTCLHRPVVVASPAGRTGLREARAAPDRAPAVLLDSL